MFSTGFEVFIAAAQDTLDIYIDDADFKSISQKSRVWNLSGNKVYQQRVGQLNQEQVNKAKITSSIRFKASLKSISLKLLEYMGILDLIIGAKGNSQFYKWVEKNEIEYIYSNLSTIQSIKELYALQCASKLPVTIHFFDNWLEEMESSVKRSPVRKIFGLKWFKRIFELNANFLTISHEMSKAYESQYNIKSRHIHNVVDVTDIDHRTEIQQVKNIAYFGRIGRGNLQALEIFVKALHQINSRDEDKENAITLSIYSNETLFEEHPEVIHRSFMPYERVQFEMTRYDLLLLPLDGGDRDKTFLKYSIPTKFTDYGNTGVPILSFGPKWNAVNCLIRDFDLAFFIEFDHDIQKVSFGIEQILNSTTEIFKDKPRKLKNYITEHCSIKSKMVAMSHGFPDFDKLN